MFFDNQRTEYMLAVIVISIISLLVIIGLLLLLIAMSNRRPSASPVSTEIDQAIKKLGEAVQHHVEVNAVLGLTKQFENKPETMANLAEYSRQTVAATLLYRVNSISSTIKELEDNLARSYRNASNPYTDPHIINQEEILVSYYKRLEEANRVVQAFGRSQTVS